MKEREVVITGVGFITPLGKTVAENWENVKQMKTGIAHYPARNRPKFFQYMGKIKDLDIPAHIPPKLLGQMKFLNRGSLLGLIAAYEALSRSGEYILKIPPERRALYIASGDFTKLGYDFMYPAIKSSTDESWKKIDHEKLNISTMNKVNPFFLLESLLNNLFSFLSAYTEFKGQNTSLASLSPCGGHALELAYRTIKQDRADIAMAVGYGNWITEIPLYEIEGLGILSECKSGIRSFRPFDKNRDGFITGEGGAAILLESAEAAKKNRTEILGKIRGFGNCIESPSKGFGVPSKVVKRSILKALDEGNCGLNDLAFLILHGSGTQKGDRSELRSVIDVFNSRGTETPICGLKPYTGHMGATSDLADIIIGIHGLREKIVPATLNFHQVEREFSGLRISSNHQKCEKGRFLAVSYGLGGQSSSVIVDIN